MKKGDIVMIFEEWLTETKPEGKAKLIERVNADDEGEQWLVKFLSDGFSCLRFIKCVPGGCGKFNYKKGDEQ